MEAVWSPQEGAMVEVVAQTTIFLGHGATNNINDNHIVCPTPLNKVSYRLDKNVCHRTLQTVHLSVSDSLVSKIVKSQTLQTRHSTSLNPQDVSCTAVNLVHSVNCLGHPQKRKKSRYFKEQN